MTSRICIVGGSSGLGLKISSKLLSEGIDIVYVSREPSPRLALRQATYFPLDLSNCSSKDVSCFLAESGPFDGFAFCQRFRAVDLNDETSFIEEYRVTVYSTLLIINSYLNSYPDQQALSVVVVGSTYASHVGFDQPPGYHCSKAAQKSLVKTLSNRFRGRLIINMFSPPTFVKDGAEGYWSSSSKASIWNSLPAAKLPSVEQIADAIILTLLNPNPYISGNDILTDGGLSHLYFDQVGRF